MKHREKMEATNNVIQITEKAIEQLSKIVADSSSTDGGVRVGVIGGGCSGLSYKIDFGQEKESDKVIEIKDFKLFIDPKSSIYLKGTILDFQDGLQGKGFVFSNPMAKNTCGCGESFSI